MTTKVVKYPSVGKEKFRSPKFNERSTSLVFPQRLSKKKSPTNVDEPRSPTWSSSVDIDTIFGDETQRRKSKRKKPSPRTLKLLTPNEEHKKNVLFDLFSDMESNENGSMGELKKARSSGSTKTPPSAVPAPRNSVSWPDMPKVPELENSGGKNNNNSSGKAGKNSVTGNNNNNNSNIGNDSGRGNGNMNNCPSPCTTISNNTESLDNKKKGSSGGSKSPPRLNRNIENQPEENNILFSTDTKKKSSSSSLSRTPPCLSRTPPCLSKTPVKHKVKDRSSVSPSTSPTSTSDETDPTLGNPPAWLGLENPFRVEPNSNQQKPHSHEKKSRTLPLTYSRKSTKERQSPSPKSVSTILAGVARGLDQGPQGPSKPPETVVAHGPPKSLDQSVQEQHKGSEYKDGKLEKIRVKCVWEEDKRFVWVNHSVTVEELLLAIENKYELPVQFGQIKFRDPLDTNDLMTITTQDDLEMLFKSDRVEVFVMQLSPPSSPFIRSMDGGLSGVVVPVLDDPDMEREQSRSSSPVTCESSPDFCHNNNKWTIKSSELIIPPDGKPLGCGYFGEVRLGYWRRRRVACKKIFEQNFRSRTDMEIFCREVKILSELRHPNIVLFLGACTDGKDKVIVTEYCQGGDLASFLKQTCHVLHEQTKLDIAKDVAAGMNHLHLENVLHRDLTSSNILLSSSYEAKVGDFGLSRRLFANTSLSCTMGSVAWMAPEVIENAKNFTKKSDVYSYAVILWELLTRQDPCPPNMSPIMLATKVLHEQYRPNITPGQIAEEWTTLIQKCWSQNPDNRPTFDDILGMLENFDLNKIVVQS